MSSRVAASACSRLLALCLVIWATGITTIVSAQAAQATQAFSIPERTEALRKAREAEAHLGAKRWGLAIQVLQDLLERERDAVLPAEYRLNGDKPSVHVVHPGAAEWARRHLLLLPEQAREFYRTRFQPVAADALTRALGNPTRKELVAISMRWPLCDAAARAWWILGDLEVEGGHVRDALVAWNRSEALRELLGQPTSPAWEARRDLAAAELGTHTVASDTSWPRAPLPSRDARGWQRPLDLEPISSAGPNNALLPIKVGKRVLVSSTLRLYCADALTGELLWDSGEPRGWELLSSNDRSALFDGIHPAKLQVAPAAGGHVAVAALQLPFSTLPNQEYRGIEVMRSIPQRRLFAFDLETGEPLWNHAPQLTYEPLVRAWHPQAASSFAEEMLIAAPPVIAGSRLLVPCYALEGRIDYHIACYELKTGELLWKTGVISGQRSRNMFGRALREFCASPVTVAGDKVIVQSELGAVAALDLLTGGILWETLYRQVPLLPVSNYRPRPRSVTWQTSAPVVVGNVVISTPSDSDEMYGFDLDDGRVLWSYDETYLRGLTRISTSRAFNLLIGADEDTVYLGGRQLAALRKVGGLRSIQPFRPNWAMPVPNAHSSSPRPLLCREVVLLPLGKERVAVDRGTGQELRSLNGTWDRGGNSFVEEGILITLAADGLRGFFDWAALLERQQAELAQAPADLEIALSTAELFARRADVALQEHELFASLQYLTKARAILEGELARENGGRRSSDLLHRVLRGEARALEEQGDTIRALETLARARTLAPDRPALRDTLLSEERILRLGNQRGAYLAVLEQLETECGDLRLPREAMVAARSVLGLPRQSGQAGRSGGRGEAAANSETAIDVGLWVLLTRADDERHAGNLAATFEDWHQVLERYPDVNLGGRSASTVVREFLTKELGLPRGRTAYASFEERASRLVALAMESRDSVLLERVSRRYPHSQAAEQAAGIRLDWAFDRGNIERVAEIVYGPTARRGAAGESRGLLRLGHLMGQRGNREFQLGALREILREDPDATSDLGPEGELSVRGLLEDLEAQVPAHESFPPRFSASPVDTTTIRGRHIFIGTLSSATEAEVAPEVLDIYAKDVGVDRTQPRSSPSSPMLNKINLLAYESDDPTRPSWYTIIDDEFSSAAQADRACAVSTNRIIVGAKNGIHAFDSEGHAVWKAPRFNARTSDLEVEDGIVVALTSTGQKENKRAIAHDATTGVLLWEIDLGGEGHWSGPLTGAGVAVFFFKKFGNPAVAHVIDLFRGRLRARIELGQVPRDIELAAWLDEKRLLVPHFGASRGQSEDIQAFDLSTGRELWTQRLPVGDDSYLARFEDDIYLITLAGQPGQAGGVYEFDADTRKLRQIIPLRSGEQPMGLRIGTLTNLETPDIFIQSSGPNLGVRVRRLRLPSRILWTIPLSVHDSVDQALFHLPVVSRDFVAIPISNKIGRRREAQLFFLDQRTGKEVRRMDLDRDLGHANRLNVRGLGDALYISGLGAKQRGLRLQIIETGKEKR